MKRQVIKRVIKKDGAELEKQLQPVPNGLIHRTIHFFGIYIIIITRR